MTRSRRYCRSRCQRVRKNRSRTRSSYDRCSVLLFRFLGHTAKVLGYSQCFTAIHQTVKGPFSFGTFSDTSSLGNFFLSSYTVVS